MLTYRIEILHRGGDIIVIHTHLDAYNKLWIHSAKCYQLSKKLIRIPKGTWDADV